MGYKKIILLIFIIINWANQTVGAEEDKSRALILYRPPESVLNRFKPPVIVGLTKPNDSTSVAKFKEALSTNNEVELKKLLKEGFDIDQLDAKNIDTVFYSYGKKD